MVPIDSVDKLLYNDLHVSLKSIESVDRLL